MDLVGLKLNGDEATVLRYLFCRNALDPAMLAEEAMMPINYAEGLGKKIPAGIPAIVFLSDETMKRHADEYEAEFEWAKMHQELMPDNALGEIYVLNGGHFIYLNNAAEIKEKIDGIL